MSFERINDFNLNGILGMDNLRRGSQFPRSLSEIDYA